MILYLCPVCEKSCKQNRETCDEFEYGQAEWIFDQDCPECSDNDQMGMLMQDEFGALCAVTDCKFEQEYKKMPGCRRKKYIRRVDRKCYKFEYAFD